MNSGMKSEFINEAVKAFWEQEACGTQESIIGTLPELSPAWFRQIEAYRYAMEPYIHSIAQFTRHSGSTVLEVGVGAGTDHVQWARAGAGLAQAEPRAWKELLRIQSLLERHFRDMQDLEFTIEDGRLWMLQCRTGKRTGFAAVRIATDLVREKRITREEALLRVPPEGNRPAAPRAPAPRAGRASAPRNTGVWSRRRPSTRATT